MIFDIINLEKLDSYVKSEGSPIDKIFKGSVTVRVLDCFKWNPYHWFLSSWRSRDANCFHRLNNIFLMPEYQNVYFQAVEHYFQDDKYHSNLLSSFVYDTIISM